MKTFCKRGHELSPDNTRPGHGRVCSTCARERDKQRARPLAWRQCSRCKVQFQAERNQTRSRIACCPECREKHPDECRALLAQAGRAKCSCGKSISKDAKQCLACKQNDAHANVHVFCSLCSGKFLPKSWRQAVGARVIFCGDCRENRAADVRRIAWAARKPQSKSAQARLGGTSDRRIQRLISECQGSVRVIYDRDRRIGTVPDNLKRYLVSEHAG